MKREQTITITESEYDKIIKELIHAHVDRDCKDSMINCFILDAVMIRHKLFHNK